VNMAYEHKPNTGSAFINDYKEEGDNKPNHKGQINVEGTLYDIAIWNSETTEGKEYKYIKVSEPFVKDDAGSPPI